jgi:adenine-specific DNA-methyltransferase
MRLIGNKTRLLDQIEGLLTSRGVVGGTFLDVFAGTASVARHFRGRGFRVRSNDLLASSYVTQRAQVALAGYPDLGEVLARGRVKRFLASAAGQAALAAVKLPAGAETDPRARGAAGVLAYLGSLAPRTEGLVARHYAEGGPAGRLFFSRDNGGRIDAIHSQLTAWLRSGALSEDAFYLLLKSLLDAADRVANISGTYGAFLKQLQHSAREPLRLRLPGLPAGPAGRAYREDANALVRRLRVDTLYLDPPYNQRQYVKNYHVLEVLAELHTVEDLDAYEATIYGKTGLRAFPERLSDYCRRTARRRSQPSPCEAAFRDLVRVAQAKHVVVSYSEEGILTREQIGQALADGAGLRRFDYDRDFVEIPYKRFRSDRNRGKGRTYRVLEGRPRDEVREWLFYVHKAPVKARTRA